ncbi:hypothetical protein FOA43_004117 [Brettanomyces nanus]|uniref:Uncharacterized protein n=1 Tax=Eeniella nana TaxID=13502 RepID=A0A875S738_EENNA|nr:uncharacterized protein FOA43_004117 [Brettanomyces nanus]QPG76723.1 hypothetical protein FOA43_004117 [Brettanomyces nanus]
MPLPVFLYWTLPIGLGIGAGVLTALIVHRNEVEEFFEDATLSVMDKMSVAIEKRKIQRKEAVGVLAAGSESDDLFLGTATLSGATFQNEKESSSKITNRRKPHGLNREDIDQWIMSQSSEEDTYAPVPSETSAPSSSGLSGITPSITSE